MKFLLIDSVVETGNAWSNAAPVDANHCGIEGLRESIRQIMYECGTPGKAALGPISLGRGCPFLVCGEGKGAGDSL